MSTSVSQQTKGRGKSKLTGITRRSWTSTEENALIVGLKDIVVRGWKCDNGFKTGYLGLLEQHMVQNFPGTDLKGTPHIASKLHVWKKSYGSICTMLTRSGFGWNDTANTIDVEDALWDEYLKYDPSARTMRNKSFPLYKDWQTIFGKDRATGENAETLADVVNDLTNQHSVTNEVSGGADHEPRGPCLTPEVESDYMSSMYGEGTSTFDQNRGKKKIHKRRRNHDDVDGLLVQAMTDMTKSFAETKTSLGELAQRIRFAHDNSLARKQVMESLSQMFDLTVGDKIKVAKAVCNSPTELDIFFGLSDEEKGVMVQMILQNLY